MSISDSWGFLKDAFSLATLNNAWGNISQSQTGSFDNVHQSYAQGWFLMKRYKTAFLIFIFKFDFVLIACVRVVVILKTHIFK